MGDLTSGIAVMVGVVRVAATISGYSSGKNIKIKQERTTARKFEPGTLGSEQEL